MRSLNTSIRTLRVRKFSDFGRRHLTRGNLVGAALVAAAAVGLWLSNDVSAGWTVGNYR